MADTHIFRMKNHHNFRTKVFSVLFNWTKLIKFYQNNGQSFFKSALICWSWSLFWFLEMTDNWKTDANSNFSTTARFKKLRFFIIFMKLPLKVPWYLTTKNHLFQCTKIVIQIGFSHHQVINATFLSMMKKVGVRQVRKSWTIGRDWFTRSTKGYIDSKSAWWNCFWWVFISHT